MPSTVMNVKKNDRMALRPLSEVNFLFIYEALISWVYFQYQMGTGTFLRLYITSLGG